MKAEINLFSQINERLLKILDDLDAIVYVIDIESYEILYINKHGNALWGDILGKKCWMSIRKNQIGPCNNCNNQTMLTSDAEGFHKESYIEPIKNKWLDSRGHVIQWVGGRKAKLSIALDVTEQKRMEEALLEGEQMFRSIINNAPAIIYTMTLEGYYSFVSSSWTEFLGHDTSEVEGRYFREFLHPEDVGIYQDFIEKVVETRSTQKKVHYRMKHKDGSWHWYSSSGSVIEDKDKNILFYIGIASDITEQVEYQDKILKSNQELEAALEEIISIEEELRMQFEQLEKQERELRDSRQLLEDIIGFLPDATFVIDKEGKILSWNKAMENMTGIKAEDVIGKGDYEYALPFYKKRQPMLVDLVLHYNEEIAKMYDKNLKYGSNNTIIVEDYYLRNEDTEKYLSIKATPLYDTKGEVIGAVESIRDVTGRKLSEIKLEYIAEHDSITGLFNRGYFEKEILNGENHSDLMVGLIVSDVDGLKIVNDTIGHQEGDKLLLNISKVLQAACPEKSIICRIGGDEFCMIIRETTEQELSLAVKKMNNLIEEYNNNSPDIPMSISHGLASSSEKHVNLLQLFKEAEEKMYYQKMMHSQSAKSKVVDVLTKALEARDYITDGHADRLCNIVETIARDIDLPEHKINTLRLFARFHDIGKVGISDKILFKPGKLNKDEFEEMKKHSEIGFRIAQAAPDFIHLSDWILKHHEWWNGQGYPFGLAGEDIPLECRILAIADAYDSMSNNRPYRIALEYEERIAELRRFAGIQFDPGLIKVFLNTLEKGIN